MGINSRVRSITEWVTAIILGLSFAASGVPKIIPAPGMVRRFEAWGYSAEFATGIGVLETLGGILVLLPRTRRLGAGLIAVDMGGAIYTHLRTGIGSPFMAVVYLLLALLLIWMTRRVRPSPEGP